MIRFLILFSAVASTFLCVAQDSIPKESNLSGIGIYYDQDAHYPNKNEDRDYSFGGGFCLGGDWINHKLNPFSYPLKWANALPQLLLGSNNQPARQYHYFQAALKAFTPDDLGSSGVVYTDRPYASLFFINFGKRTVSPTERFFINTDVRLGFYGTHLAREVQQLNHEILRNYRNSDRPFDPKGWHNQISNNGELTGMVRYQLGFLPVTLKEIKWMQYKPKLELGLGYQTYAGASVGVKLGKITSSWWSQESYGIEYGSIFEERDKQWFEMYLFADMAFRYVFYDVGLQGQFKSSNYTLTSDQLTRSVGLFEIGGAMRLNYFEIWGSFSRRTTNFSLLSRDHYWGRFGLKFYLN